MSLFTEPQQYFSDHLMNEHWIGHLVARDLTELKNY